MSKPSDDHRERKSENHGNDDEDEATTTLGEIIQINQEIEEEYQQEYIALLGGSDENNCSYAKGYVKRQALYACLTCTPDAQTDPTKRAGVCFACSNNCHDGHSLVELYTKRNFRCDCGTTKILAVRCRLNDQKLESNDRNSYNQNFSGLYCTCHRPYPDPEDTIDEDMIQCVLCEDWFHCRHLNTKVPNAVTYEEMICEGCMKQNEFLYHYTGLTISAIDLDATDLDGTLDVSSRPSMDSSHVSIQDGSSLVNDSISDEANKPEEKVEELLKDEINQSIMNIIEINKSNSETNDQLDEPPPSKRQKIDSNSEVSGGDSCKKPLLIGEKVAGATFWPSDWRKNLCNCDKCLREMKRLKVEFLMDVEDTVKSHEEKGMAKVHDTEEERAMKAFSKIDRRQQINVLAGYNTLKEKLTEFLHPYATNNQMVTKEDINRFFSTMNKNVGK